LASAESFYLQNRPYQALASARAAMNGIPKGSPDWIRAQDIALISETGVQDKKRKRR
jgi:predicted Zn-dependent protease